MRENTRNKLGVTLQSILLGLGLYFFGRVFRNNLYFPLLSGVENTNPPVGEILRYFGHVFFLIILVVYFLLVKEERHFLEKFRFCSKRKDVLWIMLGLIIGFAMNGTCILVAYLHGDIDMVPSKFNPGLLVLMFIAIAFQSSVEEFESRLWTHNRILEKADLKYAATGSALTFAFSHLLNPGISVIALINIFLVGVLFSVAYYYSKSIWFACAIHAAWNFTQNCVFGLPNSGNPAVLTVMHPTYTKESLAYDPEFGIEGTVMATIVQLIGIVLIVFIGKKVQKKKQKSES